MFEHRSSEPERIDTGDYTEEEYKTFLREIRFINRWIGDRWALRKSLLKKIEELTLYVIDQNKQLKDQQKRIEVLEEQLKQKNN